MPRQRSAPAPARSAASAASRPKPAASSPPPPAPHAASSATTSAPASAPASSGGWFSRPAAPQPAAPQHTAPPPMAAPPAAAPPAVASSGGGIMSGLIGTVVQGAALGTGSALANRAVDAVMGPRTVVHEHQHAPAPAAPAHVEAPPAAAEGPCANHVKAFADCMSKNNGDMGSCQFYFDMMQQCQRA